MKIKINEIEEYNLNLEGNLTLKEFHALVYRLNRLAKAFPLEEEFKTQKKEGLKTPRNFIADSPLYKNRELALELITEYKKAQNKKEFVDSWFKQKGLFERYKNQIRGNYYAQFIYLIKKKWGFE